MGAVRQIKEIEIGNGIAVEKQELILQQVPGGLDGAGTAARGGRGDQGNAGL